MSHELTIKDVEFVRDQARRWYSEVPTGYRINQSSEAVSESEHITLGFIDAVMSLLVQKGVLTADNLPLSYPITRPCSRPDYEDYT